MRREVGTGEVSVIFLPSFLVLYQNSDKEEKYTAILFY